MYVIELNLKLETITQQLTNSKASIMGKPKKGAAAGNSKRKSETIMPAFMKLEKPYPEYTMYESFPPDLMHTLIGGLMEGWISLVLVCCAVIGEMPAYRGRHRYNMGVLDAAIANIPRVHSMPYTMRHFARGVSCFCPK